ncbi:MAG: hypothetical protein WEE89_06155 [Gemmatimonadota bacterium]
MLKAVLAVFFAAASSPDTVRFEYRLTVDARDLQGFGVQLQFRKAPRSITLAAAAHPEYDDKYWRYLAANPNAVDALGRALRVVRVDSVRWRIENPGGGDVAIRYRLQLPPAEAFRAAWKPFLSETGGLVGGPHSFLYVVGEERSPATVTLSLPSGWQVATGLRAGESPNTYRAPDLHTLMESPMLVGSLSKWTFDVQSIPHRVFYWRLPNAVAFDTTAFVNGVERLVGQSFALFGSAPYRDYTFMFQDGAWGGLEHPNSVTLGAASANLARDPHSTLMETAHEFVHTWNLMRFKPIEYRGLEYTTQPPVAGLWFSEGLTLFYADLLVRRAGLPADDSTRVAHLETLITRYLSGPGNSRFSAEQVSRVAYNAGPGALGNYTASSHLQGELIGTMLDLVIRNSTNGQRSMDDVMRVMNTRFATRGFTGNDIEQVVSEVCGCSVKEIFDRHVRAGNPIDFDRYLGMIGMRTSVASIPAANRDGSPAIDLRIWGYETANEPGVRLAISDPTSIWAKAGLNSRDKLLSIKGKSPKNWPELRAVLTTLKLGDTVDFVVERPDGRFETRVVVSGFNRPVVRIDALDTITEQQRQLREDWLRGLPAAQAVAPRLSSTAR